MDISAPQRLVVHTGTAASAPKLSPAVWTHLESSNLTPNADNPATTHVDDFGNFGTNTSPGGYGVYIDTGCTIQQQAVAGGVIRLACDATDNDEVWLTTGGNTGTLGAITAGSGKRVIFEAKVKFGSVAAGNKFVGLSEEGLAAADTITDANALASKDLIGFFVAGGDTDALTFVYRKAGGAATTLLTYGTALEADTWYNLGFVYDPIAPPAKRLKVFINNTEQTTYGTETAVAAATFPTGEELAVLMGVKNTDGVTATTMDCDIVAAYFEQ